jgi:hypothetical protein
MRWIALVAQLGTALPVLAQAGNTSAIVRVPRVPEVTRVELDPGGIYPDINPAHGVWAR